MVLGLEAQDQKATTHMLAGNGWTILLGVMRIGILIDQVVQ
jgi:hypothetical protein